MPAHSARSGSRQLASICLACLTSSCVVGAESRPSRSTLNTPPPPPDGRAPAGELLSPAASARAHVSAPGKARPGHRWEPGYWHYDGVRYTWQPGRWEPVDSGYRWKR